MGTELTEDQKEIFAKIEKLYDRVLTEDDFNKLKEGMKYEQVQTKNEALAYHPQPDITDTYIGGTATNQAFDAPKRHTQEQVADRIMEVMVSDEFSYEEMIDVVAHLKGMIHNFMHDHINLAHQRINNQAQQADELNIANEREHKNIAVTEEYLQHLRKA